MKAVAQYCVLLTFGAALVIETGLSRELNSFFLGLSLVLSNLLIAVLIASVCVSRFRSHERELAVRIKGQAQSIEWAIGFSATKFQTTLGGTLFQLLCLNF